jgi:hypothetical protein
LILSDALVVINSPKHDTNHRIILDLDHLKPLGGINLRPAEPCTAHERR